MTSVIAPEWQTQKKRRESKKPEFIDFKRYFRFLNPENSSYDFGLKSLIAENKNNVRTCGSLLAGRSRCRWSVSVYHMETINCDGFHLC